MQKDYPRPKGYPDKKFQQEKNAFKSAKDMSVKRFQQNAARLEHSNVRNKNKGKKG